jgi:spermidine synthase
MAYIMEDSTGATELYINGRMMVSSDANSISSEKMLAFISSAMGSSGGQACVAGFGTGVMASALEGFGFETIRVTETHPELIQLSASVFSAINNDVLTREVLEITQEDARSILGRSKNNFDLIIMPYSELFTRPDLYTTGFYKLTHEKLDSSGVFCCFLSSGTLGKNRIMDILKTCGEVYPNVSLWHTGENSFAMLAAKDRLWDYCRIQRTYNFFAHRAGFENQPFEAFLANLLLGDREIRSVTEEAHVYDENKPLLKVTTNTDQETGSMKEVFSDNEINYSSVFRFSGNCVTSETYTFNIINSYRKILLARMQLLQ